MALFLNVLGDPLPSHYHAHHHLRTKPISAYHDGRINREVFKKLYEQTKYEEEPDIKRNHGLETLTQATSQTHTHRG